MGNFAAALSTLDEALRVRRAALGDAHSDVAQTLVNIGAALKARSWRARHRVFSLIARG
jgi:hypothetical protein